jgi:hypothetical protein
LNNPLIYIDPTGHRTTGESFDDWGYDAYEQGRYFQAYWWAFMRTSWNFFGMESVSKVYDNIITDRGDLTGWDIGGAIVDVGTMGKGGGLIAGEWIFGGKYIKWGRGLIKYGDEASDVLLHSIDDIASKSSKFWSKAEFNGTRVYQRNDLINPSLTNKLGRSNLQRMEQGLAPIGPDGKSINLHHMLQTSDSPIAEVTQTLHQQSSKALHINLNTIPSGINRSAFDAWRAKYWINRAGDF